MTAARYVKVQALKGFDTFKVGDIRVINMSPAVAHLIVTHYLRLLDDPIWRVRESIVPKSGRKVSESQPD